MSGGIAPRANGEGQAGTSLPKVPGYEILGEIGRGGMGVVYKGRQIGLNRIVALKMIRDLPLAGDEEIARFHTEAEAVARLQHPHIVQVYEIGDYVGRPYLSLELVDGGSLDKALDRTPQIARDAARLVEILAKAIAAAHARGIIHRDLKPANILLASGVRQAPDASAPSGGLRPPLALLPRWPGARHRKPRPDRPLLGPPDR